MDYNNTLSYKKLNHILNQYGNIMNDVWYNAVDDGEGEKAREKETAEKCENEIAQIRTWNVNDEVEAISAELDLNDMRKKRTDMLEELRKTFLAMKTPLQKVYLEICQQNGNLYNTIGVIRAMDAKLIQGDEEKFEKLCKALAWHFKQTKVRIAYSAKLTECRVLVELEKNKDKFAKLPDLKFVRKLKQQNAERLKVFSKQEAEKEDI